MTQQRDGLCKLMVLGLAAMAFSPALRAQGAASPDKASPAKPGVSDPAPIGKPKDGTTPPVLQSG